MLHESRLTDTDNAETFMAQDCGHRILAKLPMRQLSVAVFLLVLLEITLPPIWNFVSMNSPKRHYRGLS